MTTEVGRFTVRISFGARRWGILGLMVFVGFLAAAESPRQGVLSRQPASDWTNGFVTGNGTLGAIVFGQPANEVIIGNDSRLWLPMDPAGAEPGDQANYGPKASAELRSRMFLPDISALLPQVREIIRTQGSPKGYGPAQDVVLAEAKKQGYSGYQWPGNYHAGFKLELAMPVAGPAKDYQRTTDFATGEVAVAFSDQQGAITRRIFASRPDQALVMQISGRGRKVGATFSFGQFPDMRLARQEIQADADGWMTNVVRYQYGHAEGKGGYAAVLRVIPVHGTMAVREGVITVQDADEILVLGQIQPFASGTPQPAAAPRTHLATMPADYAGLLAKHATEHGRLFARNRLDLGGAAEAAMPIEDLLARDRAAGSYSPILLEKLYDVCRYAVLSSTGVLPPGGKGLWIGQWKDRWNTVYTLDANVQLEMASVLSSNLPELIGPLADFMFNERVMADCRDNARKIFGCRGIQVPQTRWVDRAVNVAWGKNSSGQYWTAGAAWFASIFYDYYLYTGDEEFLKRRLLPFMVETAQFYEDFLQPDATGKLRFSPGWSPENGLLAGAGDNPTMDIAACKELLTNLIAVCRKTGMHQERIPTWQQLIERLPQYVINGDGALAEWAFPGSIDHYPHRHASHLYPLWRSREITAAKPNLFQAARVATDRRIAAGGEDGSTHGYMILALTEIMLGRGEGAYAQLRKLLTDQYFYDNLQTAHFKARRTPWIDGTGAWNEVINGMLIGSEPGTLELLPALPPALAKGSVEGVLARGQVRIERLSWDVATGSLALTLRSAIDQEVRVGFGDSRALTTFHVDDKALPHQVHQATITLRRGQAVTITASWTAKL